MTLIRLQFLKDSSNKLPLAQTLTRDFKYSRSLPKDFHCSILPTDGERLHSQREFIHKENSPKDGDKGTHTPLSI